LKYVDDELRPAVDGVSEWSLEVPCIVDELGD